MTTEQKTFSQDDYIPKSYWGKDHWSTLAYVETVMVECAGFQVGADARMKSNRRNYRVMAQGCARPSRTGRTSPLAAGPMLPEHATKLNDGQVVPYHDDWCCLQDMAAEGLFQQGPDELEPGVKVTLSEKGTQIINALREHKRNRGQYSQFRWPVVAASADAVVA